MAKHLVFVSYKHDQPWVGMVAKFAVKLGNYGPDPAWNLESFVDSNDIAPGDLWRTSVDDALAKCSILLVLLCDDYWVSQECRRELNAVLARRANGDPVRVCFVLAEQMQPQYLRFNKDGSAVGDVAAVGDFQFLGPHDHAQKLVTLQELTELGWGKAIEKMLVHRLLPSL